ncbi:MAG: TetR/AcrR family transcriptional regulator [Chloroflexota bacterium]
MNKDQILEAAAQIIRQKGFHAASMQDIADAVNLQKASLYHHVSSKQEILLAILDQALDVLLDRISAAALQDAPVEVRLRMAIHNYLEAMAERSDLISVLLMEHRSLDPELHARHVPRRDRVERIWRKLIQEGIDEGVFCVTDPALTAKALLGVMNWTITWYRPSGRLTIEQITEHIAELFFNGLLCRK